MTRPPWSLEKALAEFRSVFRSANEAFDPAAGPDEDTQFALDGQASAELRRMVPIEHRRRLGAFFTSHELAQQLTSKLVDARGEVVVVDPSCGAGDLLLAAARSLEPSLRSGQVDARFVGIDIVREFVETAACRLEMLHKSSDYVPEVKWRTGDGRAAAELKKATHLLLNPPFSATAARVDCPWAHGNVNGAAEFLAAVVSTIPQDCHVAAVLPEVLRGGSRYRRWREWIEKRIEVEETTSVGQFDRWTDIDVFILRGRRVDGRRGSKMHHWVASHTQTKVSDRFKVNVGPVVHNRDPKRGPLRPFLVARGLPHWDIIGEVTATRRFLGRTHRGPFVAITRTSRPDEAGRARATIVTDERQIAVDNHLLVLTPIEGGVEACQSLLRVLRSNQSDIWLDQAIRCRHLTVGAVGSLPWAEEGRSVPSDNGDETRHP